MVKLTADLDRSFELQEIRLPEEDLLLRQLHLLPQPRRPDLLQPVDDVAEQRPAHLRHLRRDPQTLAFLIFFFLFFSGVNYS